MKRIIFFALLICFAVVGCSSTDNSQPVSTVEESDEWKYGGSINLACVPVDTLNPLVTKHASVSDFLSLVYEGLFECLPDQVAVSVLASGYTASENNTVYTIQLKQNVKFHDGKAFSAEDVVATLDYIFLYEGQYSSLKNDILLYSASSPDTVTITLKQPVADFVNCLDFPVLPAGLLADDFVAGSSSFFPNGTGMYRYERTENFKNIYLKSNKGWHNEKGSPFIDEVNVQILSDADTIISAFDAGVIDVVTTSWKSSAEFNLTSSVYNTFETEQNRLTFIGINCACADFDTVTERRNLRLVVDSEEITEDIMMKNAVPAFSPLRSSVYLNTASSTDKPFYSYTEPQTPDENGDDTGIILLYNSDSKIKERLAQNLKYRLENKGYKIILDPQSFNDYMYKVYNCEYDLYVGEVNIENSGNLEFMFGVGRSAQNICSYRSDELSTCVSNLNRMNNKEARVVAWNSFKKCYSDEAFQIPLYFTNGCTYVNKRISGEMSPNLSNLLTGFENLYVTDKPTE